MASPLRVDPAHLRTAAAAESAVSSRVTALAIGQIMGDAASGMAGLDGGAACEVARGLLDAAAAAVTGDLTAHSERLVVAANTYERADAELGRRLQKIAGR